MLDIKDFASFDKLPTPFYHYDMNLLEATIIQAARNAEKYGISIQYALKANSEPEILARFRDSGFGADCVSGAEVRLAVSMGFAPETIFFAGVGKTDQEIIGALESGIGSLNVESIEELEVIDSIAGSMGIKAPVCLRINPGVDAHTHKYITTGTEDNKFGISVYQFDDLFAMVDRCANICIKGLHFHIGSQICNVRDVFGLECKKASEIVALFESKGHKICIIDLGGGLGIDYNDPDGHPIPDFQLWMETIGRQMTVKPWQKIYVEPGRSLVAQCGTLVSRVLYVKKTRSRNFVILDAGMTELIRPALYGAYHKIENITAAFHPEDREGHCKYDIVGPICESSDTFGIGRELDMTRRGDLIAIRSAGAYGATMSSTYNSRSKAASVFDK